MQMARKKEAEAEEEKKKLASLLELTSSSSSSSITTRPIYLAFGSIITQTPRTLLRIALDVHRRTNKPVVLSINNEDGPSPDAFEEEEEEEETSCTVNNNNNSLADNEDGDENGWAACLARESIPPSLCVLRATSYDRIVPFSECVVHSGQYGITSTHLSALCSLFWLTSYTVKSVSSAKAP